MHVHDDGDTQFRPNVFVICTRFCSMLYDRQLLLRHNDQHLWNKADDAISCGIRKWLAHQLLGNEPSAYKGPTRVETCRKRRETRSSRLPPVLNLPPPIPKYLFYYMATRTKTRHFTLHLSTHALSRLNTPSDQNKEPRERPNCKSR